MGVAVQFSYQTWAARYPQLAASVDEALATQYFAEATTFQRNDGGGPVTDAALQLSLLNMLTAHIAVLNAIVNGGNPGGLVGRIGNATQGSTSVGTVYMTPTDDLQAWADQTIPGSTWYAATAQFRTFVYRAPPRASLTPGFGWWGSGWPR